MTAEVRISMPVTVVFCGATNCVHNTGEACGRVWIKVQGAVSHFAYCDSRKEREEGEDAEPV